MATLATLLLSRSDMANERWYTVPDLQELPLAMRVEDAAALCGLEAGTGHKLARHGAWRPFTKYTGGLLLVRTADLLRWLDSNDQEHK
jgi:hypothetical protein